MTGLGDIGSTSGGSVGSGETGGHMGGDVGEHGYTYTPRHYFYTPAGESAEHSGIEFAIIGTSSDTPQTRAQAAKTNPHWNQELSMGQPTLGAYVESKAERKRAGSTSKTATTGTTAGTSTGTDSDYQIEDIIQRGVSSSGMPSGTGALSYDVEGILSSFQQDAQAVKAASTRNYGETGFVPQQEALTKQNYTSKFVDFGSQYYGLKGLGDWTSIGVDPEITPPVDEGTTAPSDDDRGDGVDAGMDTLNSLIGGLDTPGLGAGVSFGLDAVDFDVAGMTYAESLASLGLTDLIGSVGMDILGPALSGNFGDISFKDAFGSVPDNLKDSAASVAKKESWSVDNIAKKGLGLAFSSMPMGSMISGVLNGQTVKNAFGHNSLRPAGLLGIITDALHYTQFNDMAAMKAASQGISFSSNFTGNINDYDTGFALDFGMGGITRAPGSRTYSGNMRGLSHGQVTALEAISKGYTYAGYKMNDGNGKAIGTTIASTGGLQIDPSNPFAGYISAKGNPFNAFGQGSYYATMDQVNALAKTYGVSSATVQTALNNARSKQGTFLDNINAEVEKNLSNITQSQLAGTYTPGTTAGYVGTPGTKTKTGNYVGGAPGTGTYQSGITGWAGSGSYGNVTTGGAAFGPGTPGYSADYVDDYESVDTSPSSVPSAPAPPDDMTDAYDPGFGDNNNDDGMGGPGGEGNVGDSVGGGGWGGHEGDARGGLITPGRPQNRNQYALGTPPAGVQASQSGFIDRPPSQVSEAGKVADNRPMKAKEGTYIINAAAVEFAGEKDIRKMIMDAQKEAVRRGLSTEDFERHSNLIDIAVSSGEVTIAPHLVKIIGEDRLEKINKRGIRKTEQRIAENGQQPVGAARGGFLAAGGMALPKSKPKRVNQAALGDVELRADMEEFIQTDPLARLGWNLYEKGDLDIKAIVLPSKRKVKVGVGGVWEPPKNERKQKKASVVSKFEGFAKQQGLTKSNDDVAAIHYFTGENVNFGRHDATITLLHELRHHAMNHLNKKYKVPLPGVSREESLMDVQDFANRLQARKVKPSIPEKNKQESVYYREQGMYMSPSANKELATYQSVAEEVLKDRKVPPRTKSKEVEGFFTRAMRLLGL